MPSRLASRSTGVICKSMPRPAGFAARVYTAAISCPCAASCSSVGTAKSGVPMNTMRSGIAALSNVMFGRRVFVGRARVGAATLGGFLELLHHHLALELGDIVDE